jgi:hypothetical protein
LGDGCVLLLLLLYTGLPPKIVFENSKECRCVDAEKWKWKKKDG